MTNKEEQGARLEVLIKASGKTQHAFAQSIKVSQGFVSQMIKGTSEISKKVINNISQTYDWVNIEWLLNGQGEMSKEESAQKAADENEPLEAFNLFFSSNLPVLMQAYEMSSDNLASLIKISPSMLTNLMEGSRQPWLSLLLRLRKALGVSIDAMLLWDLREPETMERLKNNLLESQQTQVEMQKTLEAILKKITELEERDKKREKEIEEVRKDIKAK